MITKVVRPFCIGAGVALAAIGVATARPPGNGTPVCYVETWYNITQTQEGNCATYADCPGAVLCGLGTVNTGFSPVTTGPYDCKDYSGGTMVGGVCTGGTPIIPSTTSVVIPRQTCTGDC